MLGAMFGFKGRLSRPGFWEVLASIVLIDVALALGCMVVADGGQNPLSQGLLRAAPWMIVLFTAWSLLAASIKRFHDRDRTGLMILIVLIPVIGWLWLLVDLLVLEGTEGRNRFGRAPHSPEAEPRSRFSWDVEPAAAAAPVKYDIPAHNPAEALAPVEVPVLHEPAVHEPVVLEPVVEDHLHEAESVPVHAEPEPHPDEAHGEEALAEAEPAQVHDEAPGRLEAEPEPPAEADEAPHEDRVLDITSDHDPLHAPLFAH
ncbi:MAG TPA: DUF805 domain-containing protein [Caulobacteraceae bacterium]